MPRSRRHRLRISSLVKKTCVLGNPTSDGPHNKDSTCAGPCRTSRLSPCKSSKSTRSTADFPPDHQGCPPAAAWAWALDASWLATHPLESQHLQHRRSSFFLFCFRFGLGSPFAEGVTTEDDGGLDPCFCLGISNHMTAGERSTSRTMDIEWQLTSRARR